MKNHTLNKTSKRRTGDHGEDLACEYYISNGYFIVDRNVYISHVGEIDVIVSRHKNNVKEYVFVEVKTRRGNLAGYGHEAVTRQKVQRMLRCAMAWISENIEHPRSKATYRLDVVSITLSDIPDIQVFEDIAIS